ncbi:MAG TPA: hypothetical protein VLA43_11975, partial [Longimicrobiales bacterium]|nr:hypothetical protein [Longimicrobiales bacterium]
MARLVDVVDRRSFLKGTAAGLVFFPHLDLEGVAAGASRRASTVALIRTGNRRDGVKRAMA